MHNFSKLVIIFVCALATPTSISAQGREANLDEASEAFNRGSQAYEAGNYESAANWFESANRLAPSETTRFAAMNSRQEQGDVLKALSHAVAFLSEYPSAQEERLTVAREILDEHRADYVEVFAPCNCERTLNTRPVTEPRFFVAPNTRHQLVFSFDEGDVVRTIEGEPGEQIDIEVEPPSREIDRVIDTPVETIDEGRGGLHPAVFGVTLGATVIAGGVLLWSGIDVQNINSDYELAVEEQRADDAYRLYNEGTNAERRTNILIGVTGGLAALTVMFAIFTDWGGDDETEESENNVEESSLRWTPTVQAGPNGGTLGVVGAF